MRELAEELCTKTGYVSVDACSIKGPRKNQKFRIAIARTYGHSFF